jgi:dipeptidase D
MNDILNLEPRDVWKAFSELNEVPRPSKREEKVQAFAMEIGRSLGLPTDRDEVGNIKITKPATEDKKNASPIVVQAHLDMVCQMNDGTIHNWDEDGISMFIDDGWVKARGTTLGADNGIGVAFAIALLRSKNYSHPPLEVLFTSDEETGMTGALGLKQGWLKGKYLLNIDTEDDTELTIGCAGGIDVSSFMEVDRRSALIPDPAVYEISISGLTGGHSGMDIHLGLGNANVLLGRVLREIEKESCALLIDFDGGNLRNAIPREAHSKILIDKSHLESFTKCIDRQEMELKGELKTTDPNFRLTFSEVQIEGDTPEVINSEQQQKLISAITGCPIGIIRMSPDVMGLVQTSNNVARVRISGNEAEILCLTRSSSESEKMDCANRIVGNMKMAGFETSFSGNYPGWEPSPSGYLADLMKNTYIEIFNEKPNVNACHAGLECGIIGERSPGMEMTSFGPNIRGAHSPDERVEIISVQKSWKYFLEILKRIE